MRTPELGTLRALAPTQPLQARGGAQAASFAQAMHSTQAEITDLVRHGWATSVEEWDGSKRCTRRGCKGSRSAASSI